MTRTSLGPATPGIPDAGGERATGAAIAATRTPCRGIGFRAGALAVLALTAPALGAQDLIPKAPPQTRAVVVRGATVHTMNGPALEGASVWFAAGRIRGVGAEADAPADAEVVDGTGLHLWPGMISAVTQVGLNEIGSIAATQDYDEIGDVTPEVRAVVGVNPDATTIPVTRSNGVLVCGVFPRGGLVPGTAGVIELDGWTWEDLSVADDVGVVVDWPEFRSSRWRGRRGDDEAEERVLEDRTAIDRAFRDARAWDAARRADPSIPHDVRHAALVPALRGERAVFVLADDLEAIRSAVAWAESLGLSMTLVGGNDADRCAPFLREQGVAVIVAGTHRLPGRRDDPFDRPFRLPAVLEDAGVRWCLASGTDGYENERNLPYHAATAIAHGLPLEAGMRGVTKDAAELLGVGDELGTIEAGKRATLILTDGHPLEVTTRVVAAWVSGRRIDLANKQTALAEKYRTKYRQLGSEPGEEGR